MSSRFVRLIAILLLLILAPGAALANGHGHKHQGTDVPVGPTVGLELVADGFTHPLMLTEAPDDSGRRFVVDQTGQIWILTPDGTVLDEPFLNVEDRMVELNDSYDERGLLGLAFHPKYEENGRFFVHYSAPLQPDMPSNFNHTARISEFRVSTDDPNKADPGSEKILLEIPEPQMNHNGGTLAFGPEDGYLYISLGDGGHRDDQGVGHVQDWYDRNSGGNGQDIEQNLLGSLLRIDVDRGDPYAIPDDNPFVGLEGVPAEQYAYGFRNPYRFSFDMAGDHDLFLGDAGQNLWEEIDLVEKGGNYGWNVMEGAHCFDAEQPRNPPEHCPDEVGPEHPLEGDPLILPVIEFRNAGAKGGGLGLVVVGGYVYRGDGLPQLDGRYLFGAWSRGHVHTEQGERHLGGQLLVAKPQEEKLWEFRRLRVANDPDGQLDEFLLSFGQDLEGEVYVLTTEKEGPTGNTGKVWKMVPPGMPNTGGGGASAPGMPGTGGGGMSDGGPPTGVISGLALLAAAGGLVIRRYRAGIRRVAAARIVTPIPPGNRDSGPRRSE